MSNIQVSQAKDTAIWIKQCFNEALKKAHGEQIGNQLFNTEYQFFLQMIRKDKKLLEFDKMDLLNCLLQVVNSGLSLSPEKKHIYIFNRSGTLIMDVARDGFKKLFKDIQPNFLGFRFFQVRNGEKFQWSKNPNENGKMIGYEPNFESQNAEILFHYVEFLDASGNILFYKSMSEADMQKRKTKSPCKPVWDNWYPEMCLKTLANYCFEKHLVTSTDSFRAQSAMGLMKRNLYEEITVDTDHVEVK